MRALPLLVLLALPAAASRRATSHSQEFLAEPPAHRKAGHHADLALVLEGHPVEHGGHEEHGGHGHSEAHGQSGAAGEEQGREKHEHHANGPGAHSVAVGLVATVVIVPTVAYMAMTDWLIASLTMKMLDTFTSIFLAVLWFNTFGQFLETFRIKEAFPFAADFFSLVQCIVLYVIAMTVAFIWRDSTLHLTTFCSVGAHFIAFSGIMASSTSQKSISKVPPRAWEPLFSFLFCFLVLGIIAAVSATAFFTFRRRFPKAYAFNEAMEDLELDIAGLVTSYCITQAVRHTISGHFPPMEHFFLQTQQGNVPHYSQFQCWFMLVWAILLTFVAGTTLPWLSDVATRGGKWAKRGVRVLKVTLIMLVAWGYLLWGEWEFYGRLFRGDTMFGHMLFACIATLVCLGILFSMALLQGQVSGSQAHETNNITITGVSLVAAWSWEHCFNIALDVLGEEYQVGLEGLVPKLVLAVVIPICLLPTYLRHIRTRVLLMEEEAHAEEEEEEAEEKPTEQHEEGAPEQVPAQS